MVLRVIPKKDWNYQAEGVKSTNAHKELQIQDQPLQYMH